MTRLTESCFESGGFPGTTRPWTGLMTTEFMDFQKAGTSNAPQNELRQDNEILGLRGYALANADCNGNLMMYSEEHNSGQNLAAMEVGKPRNSLPLLVCDHSENNNIQLHDRRNFDDFDAEEKEELKRLTEFGLAGDVLEDFFGPDPRNAKPVDSHAIGLDNEDTRSLVELIKEVLQLSNQSTNSLGGSAGFVAPAHHMKNGSLAEKNADLEPIIHQALLERLRRHKARVYDDSRGSGANNVAQATKENSTSFVSDASSGVKCQSRAVLDAQYSFNEPGYQSYRLSSATHEATTTTAVISNAFGCNSQASEPESSTLYGKDIWSGVAAKSARSLASWQQPQSLGTATAGLPSTNLQQAKDKQHDKVSYDSWLASALNDANKFDGSRVPSYVVNDNANMSPSVQTGLCTTAHSVEQGIAEQGSAASSGNNVLHSDMNTVTPSPMPAHPRALGGLLMAYPQHAAAVQQQQPAFILTPIQVGDGPPLFQISPTTTLGLANMSGPPGQPPTTPGLSSVHLAVPSAASLPAVTAVPSAPVVSTTMPAAAAAPDGSPFVRPHGIKLPPKPVRKPKVPNAAQQQAYEEYIEWKKTSQPGYAQECKLRQARRVLRSVTKNI